MKNHLIVLCFLMASMIVFGNNLRDSLTHVVQTTDNDSVKIRALNHLGFVLLGNDPDSAISVIEEGIRNAKKNNFYFGLAELYNTKANYYLETDRPDSALAWYDRAMDLSKVHQFHSISTMITNNLGLYHWRRGNYPEALEQFTENYKHVKSNPNASPKQLAQSVSNIGLIHQEMQLYEKAIEFHEEALEIRLTLNNPFDLAISLANLGVCYKGLDDLPEAIRYYRESIEQATLAGADRVVQKLYGNLGNAYLSQNQYDLAVENLEKSIFTGDNIDYKSNLHNLSNLVSAYTKLNQLPKALNFGRQGLEILNNRPDLKSYSADLHLNLAVLWNALGNQDSFAHYNALFIEATKAHFSDEHANRLAEWEAKFEVIEKDNRILQQQNTLVEQQLKISRTTLWMVILLAFLAMSLTLIFVQMFRRKKERELLAKEREIQLHRTRIHAGISSQEKERKRLARDLHDGFGQLISSLKLNLANQEEEPNKDKRCAALRHAQSIIDEMYAEIRNTAFNLMPATLIEFGLKEAVRELAQRVNRSGLVRIKVDAHDVEERLPEWCEISIFRIIQEWTNNILKYSKANEISIQLTGHQDELTVIIEDNGNGFDPKVLKKSSGHGWSNIRARLNQLHGSYILDTAPNAKQTSLVITIPKKQSTDNKSTIKP
ncbi:MAG: tetratricopeptide repeat protein [Cryomorphaceae bacterium]|nr:tetratricopeptide repeat protein [Cryomorphaceae bacterium]